MPKKAVTATRDAQNAGQVESQREFLLAMLNQAHIDFAALGKLPQAGPLLNELMGIAYESAGKTGERKTA